MTANKTHTEEFLNEVASSLRHEGGVMYWANCRKKYLTGQEAGYRARDYIGVIVAGQQLLAHHVVWFLEHGEWPSMFIDHIDGNTRNNHPSNLRLATPLQNSLNRRVRSGTRSGFKGVTPLPNGRFNARINHGGKRVSLGIYETPERAHQVYLEAARRFFGEYAHA